MRESSLINLCARGRNEELARWSLVLAQRPHETARMVTLWAVRVEARTFETNRATL
jgi:hypothetical protein